MQLAERSPTLSPRFHAALASAMALLLVAAPITAGAASVSRRASFRQSGFTHAERLRDTLENCPEQARTRVQYERVLDAYRAVYHGNPASSKADASVVAGAELLAEEGRVFHDDKALHDAIGQYEFLRHQYPGSRYRFSALLAEGEIYQHDLGDLQRARLCYLSFLRQYPRNALAVQAHAELENAHRGESVSGRQESKTQDQPKSPQSPDFAPERSAAAAGSGSHNRSAALIAARDAARMQTTLPPQARLALVKGIRHWSAPDYTRVVIDLQKVVQYEAVRVQHPQRIYFDLYGTHLAPGLAGHSIRISRNGLLTHITELQPAGNVSRIVLDVQGTSDYSAFFLEGPPRLIIDVHGRQPESPRVVAQTAPRSATQTVFGGNELDHLEQSPAVETKTDSTMVDDTTSDQEPNTVADTTTPDKRPPETRALQHPMTGSAVSSMTDPPDSSRGSFRQTSRKPSPLRFASDPPPAEAVPSTIPVSPVPTRQAPNSMVRALGLKINRIVIDAGHGGHDSGTLGPGGLEEKDVVLDVALRLGRLLRQRLGADVIYTRSDDTFVPLETRTAIANRAQADLFISIHANSSPDTAARGVEVYYLNFTTSADALEVAARENAASDQSIHQLSDLVKKIALDDKINESRAFAEDVDQSLYAGLEAGNPGLRDRGVKKAPFVVLIGASMPSILAEISFLTNRQDASELRNPAYRQRIAAALYRGVAQYVSSLNGVRLAQARPRTTGSE